MDQLAPSMVPTYETRRQGRRLWQRCADRDQPFVAIREGERGYVVRYDLQHLDAELADGALRRLRDQVRARRPGSGRVDPHSETARLGGDTGPIAGMLHAETEAEARDLASRLSALLFDDANLT